MPEPHAKSFFVIAGENSGDMLASFLIREIQKCEPNSKFRGLGGPQIAACGVELLQDIVQSLAIIGITQVLKNIRKIYKLFKQVEQSLRDDPPDAVILVDYPGFNLRVAKLAHELGIPVIYYVFPQVWAWHKNRIHVIRKYIDLMIVFLPFEEDYCKRHGVPVGYHGHPLLDVLKLTRSRDEVCRKFDLDPARRLIGLLPGSRKPEIVRILPIMLEACEMLHRHDPSLQFVLPRATSVSSDMIQKYLLRYNVPVNIVDQERYNVRSTLDFALVKSGTATLETAILECPMIVIYKTSWLTWLIGKSLLDIHYIGLVNILAEKMIVPEILQDEATGLNIYETTRDILQNETRMDNIRYELQKVKNKLGAPGASRKAAEHIIRLLNEKANGGKTSETSQNTEPHASK